MAEALAFIICHSSLYPVAVKALAQAFGIGDRGLLQKKIKKKEGRRNRITVNSYT